MTARKPIIHGRDHACGGADPIPGICQLPTGQVCVSWPDRVGEIVTAGNTLLGLWRLGEAASPFADTSGHGAGAADAVKVEGGADYTTQVTGALQQTGDDDGAVEFNGHGATGGDSLHVPEPGSPRFNFAGEHSIAVWVKPRANASTFDSTIANAWKFSGSGACGWNLYISWPSLSVTYLRRAVGGTPQGEVTFPALTADEWSLIVATYDTTNGHLLYVNGALEDTDSTLVTGPTFNLGFDVAAPTGDIPGTGHFYGYLDELSIWSDALTPAQVASLYTGGLPCTPSSGSGEDGQVIVANGDGTTGWAYPTTKVDGARYDEILTGANLTSTDNTDGTVTLDASGAGGASPADTACWMPLTTTVGGDDVLVFDADHSLIPTLTPI